MAVKSKALPNAVKLKTTEVKRKQATVNPFTGKRFASVEEHQAFSKEQSTKLRAMQVKQRSKEELRAKAIVKVLKVFTDAGVTEEEARMVFGRKFR